MFMKNYKGIHNKIGPLIREKKKQLFEPKPKKKVVDFKSYYPDIMIYGGITTQKYFRKIMFDFIHKNTRIKTLSKNRKNRWSKETREKYALIKQAKWEEEQKELILKNEV